MALMFGALMIHDITPGPFLIRETPGLLLLGVIGYLMRKAVYEPVPLVLAFVLGPILETSFPDYPLGLFTQSQE